MNSIPLVAYSINNMYFMGIQAGIQAYHSCIELGQFCHKLGPGNENRSIGKLHFDFHGIYSDWADNHKSVSILNGGTRNNLEELASIIERSSFPSKRFYERDCSEDAFSSITVVCPNVRDILKRKYLHKFISNEDYCMFEHLVSLRVAT